MLTRLWHQASSPFLAVRAASASGLRKKPRRTTRTSNNLSLGAVGCMWLLTPCCTCLEEHRRCTEPCGSMVSGLDGQGWARVWVGISLCVNSRHNPML